MVGVDKQHTEWVLVGRSGGIHGVLLRGADNSGETASSKRLSRVMDGSLAVVGSFRGGGSKTRYIEGPRGG